MYKTGTFKREVFTFRCFANKGYSLFAALGREVIIGTLSVATLSHAQAESMSVEPLVADTVAERMDKELLLEEVNVTGSRAPITLGQAARMVTVLGREDIAQAPAQSINDLLKTAVGVDVRQRGPLGSQTDIGIRGSNYEQITILLDGINICDPQTGHNAFDFPVDISDIERIEVLEGPAGRVYGTSSLLGAINIITKSADKSSVKANIEGGSYGYLNAGGGANITSGSWANTFSGSYTRSDGYSRSSGGNLNADYSGGKAFYKGCYDDANISVRWHAGVSTKDFGSNTFYGVKWDNQFEHVTKTFTALQTETKAGSFHIRPAIYWNRTLDRFELYRGDAVTTPFNYHRTDVFGGNINSWFDWVWGRTAIGVELRNEDVISTKLGETLDESVHIHGTDVDYTKGLNRTNISFMLEHNVILNRFTLSAGFVAAKNSWNNMPMKIYPGIDIGYRLDNHWKVYASWNTSLRMPSVTELYYTQEGYSADKYLKAEELSSFEGGVKYSSYSVRGSASVYYNHCTNLIDWIRDTSQGADAPWQSVNFTEVNAIGVEASFTLDFIRLLPSQHFLKSVSVAYNYIHQSKDEEEYIQSKYTLEYLRHKLVASAQMAISKRVQIGLSYRFQDRMGTYTDVDGLVCDYHPYGVLDARLSWSIPRYTLFCEANNLFDKSYVDYGNIPQPGTWIVVGGSLSIDL